MATTATNIITEMKEIARDYLGATWSELPHVTDLSKNDLRRGAKGYGVRPLGASSVAGLTNSYTLDHDFELVLMDSIQRKDSESQGITVMGDLFDKHDEIFKDIAGSKVNLSGTVLLVANPTLSAPEYVGEREFVAIRQQITVRYRQTI